MSNVKRHVQSASARFTQAQGLTSDPAIASLAVGLQALSHALVELSQDAEKNYKDLWDGIALILHRAGQSGEGRQ